MIYEIVNPSDRYTIEAHSLDVAFVACACLGAGQYSFRPLEDENAERVPMFLFGGADDWVEETLSEPSAAAVIDRVLNNPEKRIELAECYESCLIGMVEDRKIYQAGLDLIDNPKKRDEWRRTWHDSRRSSLNDIGARARKMAEKLRSGEKQTVVEAPQQVFAGV